MIYNRISDIVKIYFISENYINRKIFEQIYRRSIYIKKMQWPESTIENI